MGEEESFLPFDYCYLYNNANKNAKYFLPMLVTKLFGFALFSSTLTAYPFYMMILHLLLSVVFLIFVCCAKPFQSKLTQARIIVTEVLLIAIQCAFTLYQFYAQKLIYLNSIEFYLIIAVIVLLSFAIIFTLIEQYRIWKDSLSSLCEGCCLYFRLRGNSKRVEYKPEVEQNTIKVEEVKQEDIGEVDAFYARMLQKQALNKQYKRERMIHDQQWEKSFA